MRSFVSFAYFYAIDSASSFRLPVFSYANNVPYRRPYRYTTSRYAKVAYRKALLSNLQVGLYGTDRPTYAKTVVGCLQIVKHERILKQ